MNRQGRSLADLKHLIALAALLFIAPGCQMETANGVASATAEVAVMFCEFFVSVFRQSLAAWLF